MTTPKVGNRNEWIFGNIPNALNDKDFLVRSAVVDMLQKSTRMFKYTCLPDTIEDKDVEIQLQVNGFAVWKEVDGKLYTFTAGLGGEPDPYYLPTIAVIANPALKYNASLDIGKDCVVMRNDNFYQGLMPIFGKYARLIAEAEISLKYALINTRVPSMVQADNDGTYKSAEEFLRKIVEGKDYGIISSKEFFDGIKTQDFYKQSYIKDIIESIQYLRGCWYHAIGLNSPFNMKREAINEAETNLNDEVLYPFIDTMLECRQKAIKQVNEMFGSNITIELDSVWASRRITEAQQIET